MVAKTTCVVALCNSWEGLISSDVAIGRSEVMGLVDCRFFCCMRRWPLLVARDLERCLVTKDAVRPGHELKWPRWMARRNVDGRGLKAQACRKAARSCLVRARRMAPFAEWWETVRRSGDGESGDFGASGMFQRPLILLRAPTMMACPSL
jgi:hypothetical protein